MGVNSVKFGSKTIIDITDSTVIPETLGVGVTAYDKSGEKITGTMPSAENLDAILSEQEALIAQLQQALEGKAGGGSEANNYAKVYVTPTSSTSITINNPLGGIAKAFAIRRVSDTTSSTRKIFDCVGALEPPVGAVVGKSSSDTVRYVIQRTTGSLNNAYYQITEGQIKVYRYNSANTWDTSEYEVEIWQ